MASVRKHGSLDVWDNLVFSIVCKQLKQYSRSSLLNSVILAAISFVIETKTIQAIKMHKSLCVQPHLWLKNTPRKSPILHLRES